MAAKTTKAKSKPTPKPLHETMKCRRCGEQCYVGTYGIVCSCFTCPTPIYRPEPPVSLEGLRERYSGLVIEHEPTTKELPPNVCPACEGEGKVECEECDGDGMTECDHCGSEVDCDACRDGMVECRKCQGRGNL